MSKSGDKHARSGAIRIEPAMNGFIVTEVSAAEMAKGPTHVFESLGSLKEYLDGYYSGVKSNLVEHTTTFSYPTTDEYFGRPKERCDKLYDEDGHLYRRSDGTLT